MLMRRLLATAFAVAGVGFAHGALTSQVTFSDGYGTGIGGEFKAAFANFSFAPNSLTGGSFFETFCLERNETIQFGRTYFADFSTSAKSGGAGGPNPDPLDARTAFLYTNFIRGELAGYDYSGGAGRASSANALQNAIWYLEQEITNLSLGLNGAEQALAAQFVAAANNSGWTDIGGVRVMNVYANADGTGNHQDQLIMVPAPSAAVLGLIGLLSAGRFRRTA